MLTSPVALILTGLVDPANATALAITSLISLANSTRLSHSQAWILRPCLPIRHTVHVFAEKTHCPTVCVCVCVFADKTNCPTEVCVFTDKTHCPAPPTLDPHLYWQQLQNDRPSKRHLICLLPLLGNPDQMSKCGHCLRPYETLLLAPSIWLQIARAPTTWNPIACTATI
jgi:hypothetical protein